MNIDPRTLTLTISQPSSWWQGVDLQREYHTPEEMMAVAMTAAENNLCSKAHPEKHGGPFGAATFLPAGDGGFRLFSLGANLVLETGQADSHAEILAGRFASARLKAEGNKEPYNLWSAELTVVTTSAPCAMCENFLVWARPRRVIAGTSIRDTQERLGFHEGCQHRAATGTEAWVSNLESFGISVSTGVLRQEVLTRLFDAYSGPIYNGGE